MGHDDHLTGRPEYDAYKDFSQSRSAIAASLAGQVLSTIGPWLSRPESDLDVLDVGSGYGGTALALRERCRSVVGLEPARDLHDSAVAQAVELNSDVRLVNAGVEALEARESFDLVVLDNVYEHLPDQDDALTRITTALRSGGILYILVPNKLWPIEAHYGLPGLAWLPLRWADRYLRVTGRGRNYADASYAPTYWRLRRALDRHPELSYRFVLPADPAATVAGTPLHYRFGMRCSAGRPHSGRSPKPC